MHPFMNLVSELKRRRVFQVAVVYAVVAWLLAQIITSVEEPLRLPTWFDTAVIVLLVTGFPVALVLAWALEITPDGIARTDAGRTTRIAGVKLEFVGLGVVILGVGWFIWHTAFSNQETTVSDNQNVVILMDTAAPGGVYDSVTRSASGTNADDLNDGLRDLPILLQKETISSTWGREEQIALSNPDLIIIHRSAFFHSMNFDFGAAKLDRETDFGEQYLMPLYEVGENKLFAFLGYIGLRNPGTKFLVYSRAHAPAWAKHAPAWAKETVRIEWVENVVHRFPFLADRVFTISIPGGSETASFRDESTIKMVRREVQSLLGIESTD